ncbi:MAG: large conductance mechanosensitive channel protein MscL [Ruminococcaceae bacterium]|nr:large conductance mechanosensitive channel protein MscL [Oscillospiraceae bacterium]
MKKFFSDFKEFIMRGNILDMAVGVVIGNAFKEIVNALVANIITPLISLATGSNAIEDMKYVFKEAVVDAADPSIIVEAEVALTYGVFLQAIIDFLIIAFSIFVTLRIMLGAQKKLEALRKKKEEEAKAEEPAAPAETELTVLCEIREMLKKEADNK